MLADIASGETDFADVFFLIALVAFALDVVVAFVQPTATLVKAVLVSAGLGFVALGLLLL